MELLEFSQLCVLIDVIRRRALSGLELDREVVCLCVCMYVCMYVSLSMGALSGLELDHEVVCLCVCVCVYVCMYVCVHVCIIIDGHVVRIAA